MACTVSLPSGMTVTADTAGEAAQLLALLGGAAPALPATPRIEAPPPRIASDAAPTLMERPATMPRTPGKRGRKMNGGKGGVYPTASGKFRFRVHVDGRQIHGPSRATREESEADLAAARSTVQPGAAAPDVEDPEPTSFMDPIARAPRRGPHEVDRIGPKRSRVVHSFDAPTTGEGFARCGARGDSLIVTGKTSAVNCVDCLRLIVDDKVTGLARSAESPVASADVVEREETRLRNLAELREMARHIPSLPPRLRGMAEEQLAGKRTVEIAGDRGITAQSVHQAMSQARRILRRAAYVAGERASAAPPQRMAVLDEAPSNEPAKQDSPPEQVIGEDLSIDEAVLAPDASAEVQKEEMTSARAVESLVFQADPATCAKSQTDPSCLTDDTPVEVADDPDDDAPPLRKAQRRCSRCGIPGHRATTCDVQPLSRDERRLAIEAWATRRRAPAAPAAPPAETAPPPLVCRTFSAEEDFSEFLPDEITEPPEPAGAVGAPLPQTPASALPAPADHPPLIDPTRLLIQRRGLTKTISAARHLTLSERVAGAELEAPADVERPRTRGDCEDGDRPCPWVSCSHHLFLDVDGDGALKLNFPHLDPDQLAESCSLDVADRGGITLEVVGQLLGDLSRERARQIETIALGQLAEHAGDIEASPVRGSNAPEDAVF